MGLIHQKFHFVLTGSIQNLLHLEEEIEGFNSFLVYSGTLLQH